MISKFFSNSVDFFWEFWIIFSRQFDYLIFSVFIVLLIASKLTKKIEMTKVNHFGLLVLSSFIFNGLLKSTLQVPIATSINPNTWAFPSGNMQFLMVFFLGLIHFFFQKNGLSRVLVFSAFVLVNIFNGYFLIRMGYHNMFDTIGGVASGLIWFFIYIKLIEKNVPKRINFSKFFIVISILALGVFGIYSCFNKTPFHMLKIAGFCILYSIYLVWENSLKFFAFNAKNKGPISPSKR